MMVGDYNDRDGDVLHHLALSIMVSDTCIRFYKYISIYDGKLSTVLCELHSPSSSIYYIYISSEGTHTQKNPHMYIQSDIFNP